MPEGDSIAFLARRVSGALLGQRITRARSFVVEVDERALIGHDLGAVEARGKNLLLSFSSGFTLRVHLLMRGRAGILRGPDAPTPSAELKLWLGGADCSFAVWRAQVVELIASHKLDLTPALARLGPDPLATEFDLEQVVLAMARSPERPIAEVLLDQRVMAGIGNALKNEALFLAGADPFARVCQFSEQDLRAIAQVSSGLLRMTAGPRLTLDRGRGRLTRRTPDALSGRGSRSWVYERGGLPCLVCGARIEKQAVGSPPRSTYRCPVCQPAKAAVEQRLVPPIADVARARLQADGKVRR